jgi:hypothetical protein
LSLNSLQSTLEIRGDGSVHLNAPASVEKISGFINKVKVHFFPEKISRYSIFFKL